MSQQFYTSEFWENFNSKDRSEIKIRKERNIYLFNNISAYASHQVVEVVGMEDGTVWQPETNIIGALWVHTYRLKTINQ